MRCPRCRHENRPQAKFCEECASPLVRSCPHCGADASPTAKFCSECATPLVHGGDAASRFGAPDSYTPKHLADQILTSRAVLESERKQVTVLFADVKASMELLGDRDPEEARKLLDPVLERMMEAVHRCEGTVNQVMGDGIMALFGAPLAHEDHAVRACYAALRMQETVGRYGDELQRVHGVPVQIRIGLNSGEVVVRSIGSDLRMDYSAVGQTTHLAARMEQMAKPGSTLLTAATLHLAEGYVQVSPLGPVPVRGLEAPVEVYLLVGAGPARSRLMAAATRGFTRFVGRSTELDQLQRAFDLARGGHGQVVAVVGEPGVGKSRLFHEFTHSHRTHDCLVLEAASVSYGRATPYFPVRELLRSYLRVTDRDDARTVHERVTGKVLTLDRTLEDASPALLSVLELLPAEHSFLALDPSRRRQRTLDAIKRLLLRESHREPIILVFEDLHWIDTETQALLDGLVESAPAARVLLLVNYRPEYHHSWGSKTYYTQLRIDPLPADTAQQLLAALLGTDGSLNELKALLIARTEGNPLFLEECVRALVETRALTGERGAYSLASRVHAVNVPATVQALLSARIDRLDAGDKELLQIAAVIGKDVPATLLAAVSGIPEAILAAALARLQAGELLYESRLFPDVEYTFKHALTHEVAYGSLLTSRRRALHDAVLAALERLHAERVTEHTELLAHHAVRAEAWEAAHRYLRRAGARALSRSAYAEATTHYDQALTALAQLPETPERVALAIDLRFDLRNPLHALGELPKLLERLREAERLAHSEGDARRLGRARSYMSQYLWLTGKNMQAIEVGEQALSVAGTEHDPSLDAATRLYLGLAHHALGHYRQAAAFLGDAVARASADAGPGRVGLSAIPIHARTWLALCLAELGEFGEAHDHAAEARRLADDSERAFDIVTGCFGVGYVALLQGRFEAAAAVLGRAIELVRSNRFATWHSTITASLGHVNVLLGRLDEGLALLEEAGAGSRGHYRRRQIYLAEAYAERGRHTEAREVVERILGVTRERGERGSHAWALRSLAEIAARSDPPDVPRAEAAYREAMRLANDLGMRPLLAHCRLGLGRLYRAVAKQADAGNELRAARDLLGALGMERWRAEADAALGGLH